MLFNYVPSDDAKATAFTLVANLFERKSRWFHSQDEDGQVKILKKNPEYLYELSYEEEVPLGDGRKTNLRQWFRKLASQENLMTMVSGGFLAVNDMALVNSFVIQSSNFLFRKGKEVKYVVEGEGRKVKFVKAARALQKRQGEVTMEEILSGSKSDSHYGNSQEVDNFLSQVAEKKKAQTKVQQSVDAEDRAQQSRIAELEQQLSQLRAAKEAEQQAATATVQ